MAKKLDWKRRIAHFLIQPMIKCLLHFFWKTCRVTIVGTEHGDSIINSKHPAILCYWHQQQMFGTYYALKLLKRGLKLGFLISPSVHGEVPARIVTSWGAHAIRGSSNRTGARALRDLFLTISKEGISMVTTPDGPTGPAFKFKQGAIMLAQLTQAPILPIAYSASSSWRLKTWDQSIIPKPFSKIVITVGKPYRVDKKATVEQQAEIAIELENILNNLADQPSDSK